MAPVCRAASLWPTRAVTSRQPEAPQTSACVTCLAGAVGAASASAARARAGGARMRRGMVAPSPGGAMLRPGYTRRRRGVPARERAPPPPLELELLVRRALEREAVQRRDAEALDGVAVLGRRVADVVGEAPARMQAVGAVHEAVARDLGDDRGGGDGRALGVSVDDRAQRPLELLAEREAVAEALHAGPGDAAQRVAQRREVRLVQPEAVDAARAAADDVHLRRGAH